MNRLVTAFAFVLSAPILFAQTKSCETRAWEHEHSDIAPMSRIHFGHFENGMRYAWMENHEPAKRCYLRLHVNAGSLAEREDEQGIAHFLEHMAFNGSKHFPAGTLIEWFQKHGMAFGADTNAHTSFGATVYKLDLPTSDEKTIREGLTFFRDVADGLTIADKEVQSEKGVIDGEERELDSAQFRVAIESLKLEYAGTLPPTRLPMGIKDVRDKFEAKRVRSFYERWYRPENMTLVIVGDLGSFNPESLIKETFGDLAAPKSTPDHEPPLGKPRGETRVFTIYEKEIPTVSIGIEKLKPWEDRPANASNWTRDTGLQFARAMLNLRFSELGKKEGAPFLSAGVGEGGGLKIYEGEALRVHCQPEKWKEALAVCEQELRRAIEFGFQESELAEVRADGLRGLTEAVEREKTRASLGFAESILNAAEERSVPASAATRMKIMKPAIDSLTVEKCHQDFKKAWSEGTLFVSATGNLDLGKDGGNVVLENYEASRKIKVEPTKNANLAKFAYASSAEKAGKIKSRKHIEDLDFEQVEFDNGVKVNIKRTEFKEKQIVVAGRLGEGSLTLEPADSYLGHVASQVFGNCGLGAHSEDDLRKLTAGKQVGVSFGVAEDHFRLSGGTTKEDLLFECELVCAYLNDPGWREEGLRQYQKHIPELYESLLHQPQGPLVKSFLPNLYSHDPRFGIPPRETVEKVTLDPLKKWLTPFLKNAPIEISFVGALDIEETVKACAQTFGALGKRRAIDRLEERRKVPAIKTGFREDASIQSTIPKSLVVMAFPSNDGIQAARRRNLSLLGEVINDRLRLEVREKLGASYSPGAGARSSETYPGDGMLVIQAMADPDKVPTLVDACLGVADSLSTNGVTQEELDRLREPILAQLRDALRTNGYWINVIGESQTRPEVLDDARSLVAHYKGVKVEDLTPLAKQYLKKDRASILVVSPEKKKDDEAKPKNE